MSQATYADVYGAHLVRQAEFGQRLLELEADDLPEDVVVAQLIDLYGGMESAARLPAGPAQTAILADLIETYGLGQVGTDPFLRALLPPVPATGAQVVELVLNINGFDVEINDYLISVGAVLVPNAVPVYGTPLLPGQSIGAYSYNGMVGTVLSFDATSATAVQPFTAFLWVGGQQVGRVDYPPVAAGNGFSLLYNGTLYYSFFPVSTNQLVNL